MAAKNRIVRSEAPKSLFPSAKALITSTTSFNQGDLLVLDTTNHKIIVAAAETDGATILGIASVTVVNGKIQSPYNTDVVASQAIADIPGPVYGVVAKLVLKTGEALVAGGLVYLDPATAAYGVAASGTKAIGIYQGAAISSATAGQEIEVLVGARYAGDVLKF